LGTEAIAFQILITRTNFRSYIAAAYSLMLLSEVLFWYRYLICDKAFLSSNKSLFCHINWFFLSSMLNPNYKSIINIYYTFLLALLIRQFKRKQALLRSNLSAINFLRYAVTSF